jgi:RNA polymerase sigma factor (TIGR02999 family)
VALNDATRESLGDVTRLLQSYAAGSLSSFNELMPIVYQELKRIAAAQLRRSGVGQRMQTTLLVHEAYEKLVRGQTQQVNDRRHFFAIASRTMRQIVIDTYRAESTAKRGAGVVPEVLLTSGLVDPGTPEGLFDFERAMQRLSTENQELAEVVDLSCFGGLSNEEIAELTGENVRTIQRRLVRAQAWINAWLDRQT